MYFRWVHWISGDSGVQFVVDICENETAEVQKAGNLTLYSGPSFDMIKTSEVDEN